MENYSVKSPKSDLVEILVFICWRDYCADSIPLQLSEKTVTDSHRCVRISLCLCVKTWAEVWRASWPQTAPIAALGGRLAAELNNLEVLEEKIQDKATNTTRFLVLSHKMCPPTGNDRTSVMFSVRHKAGSLVKALEPFNEFHINMSKIESRPSKQKEWEYFFFVDIAGHCEDPKLSEALQNLEEYCNFIKVLGSYPDSEVK